MDSSNFTPPGVYTGELGGFPNSVIPVATAVPAFIGYTAQAAYGGKSLTNQVVKITSLSDFITYFCLPDPTPPADPAKQYNPEYYLVPQKSQPKGASMVISGTWYAILPDTNTIYYLYNSVKLFYNNGGGDAYIVSVGTYGAPSGKPTNPGDQIVNTNVKLNDLTNGLAILQNRPEPTMYICPEATLLSIEDNATLMQTMLLQSNINEMTISIFDIIGGNNPDPVLYTKDIEAFRVNTGANGLGYGVAYYPFIGTTIMQDSDIDYTNLFGGDTKQLEPLLNPYSMPNSAAVTILSSIQDGNKLTVSQNQQALLMASVTYQEIIAAVLASANILPPSGAMAGVMTYVDDQSGVWTAPANVSIVGVSSLPIYLNDSQQGPLNTDPVSGKSINAIRSFSGLGILVWGARTLDGNSQDWRYISVRRTMIYLEQSCKQAAAAFTFAPNTAMTWQTVTAMISSFLTDVWKQGGLQGSTPSDAFSVSCGLGTTMTGDDILNGFMNVTVMVAVLRPAEFIVFSFQQEMVD